MATIRGVDTETIQSWKAQGLIHDNTGDKFAGNTNEILYNQLISENARIMQYIQLLKSQKTTDTQRFQYQSSTSDTLSMVYNGLFMVYFIVLLILCYMLFIKNQVYSRGFKIGIILLFLAYPFVIYPLETWIYIGGNYIYTMLIQAPYGENPIDTYKKDRGDIYVTK
jgi:hypothetical protein|uniref:Uncharacterized protein n=1 Tax=viral metagenome TaxID=1070528 RepID=A0A6C0IBU9_9ZZZZ